MATKKESAADGGQGKKSRLKLIIMVFLMVMLAGGGGGGYYYYKHVTNAEEPEEDRSVVKRKKVERDPVFVALDVFTVNLRGEEGQLLQVAITLQMSDEEDATKLRQFLPLVRSRLIMLLTSKRASDVLTVEGKNELAQQVAAEVSQPFFAGDYPLQIQNVMFTSFIVQ